MKYSIYCDGSTKGNGKKDSVGAWAYVVVNAEYNTMSFGDCQAVEGTTNQRMELQAAIEALRALESIAVLPEDSITVYTDSAYLHNCFTQCWYTNWIRNNWKNSKKEPVANRDLWEQLVPYFTKFGVDFVKVKGHAGGRNEHEKWNEYVDELAQNAAARTKEKKDASCCH